MVIIPYPGAPVLRQDFLTIFCKTNCDACTLHGNHIIDIAVEDNIIEVDITGVCRSKVLTHDTARLAKAYHITVSYIGTLPITRTILNGDKDRVGVVSIMLCLSETDDPVAVVAIGTAANLHPVFHSVSIGQITLAEQVADDIITWLVIKVCYTAFTAV